MTCLLKSKIQKIFLTLRIFLKHEAACIVQYSVYNYTGNAHKNELGGGSNTSHPSVRPSTRDTPRQSSREIKDKEPALMLSSAGLHYEVRLAC